MKYKCKDIQILILEGRADQNHPHIKRCTECVQFLNAHHDLANNYNINDVACPTSVDFEDIYAKASKQKPKKSRKILHIAELMAAAACLILSLMFFGKNGTIPVSTDYANEINQAINDLNTSIDSMEIDLIDNQELLSASINEIEADINFLQKEMTL